MVLKLKIITHSFAILQTVVLTCVMLQSHMVMVND